MKKILEEDSNCPEEDCNGKLKYIRQDPCNCFKTPPCSACVDAPLMCPICNYEVED